jgi:signal transduction histidine kinase
LLYAGLTGITFLLLFSVIFWSTARFMRHQIDDMVSNELNEILSDGQQEGSGGVQAAVQALVRHPSGFYYLLQDSHGRVLAGNLPPLDATVGIREFPSRGRTDQSAYAEIRGEGFDVSGNYLFVGWSTRQLHEMEEFVARSFALGLAACVALALLGGVVMSRRLMRKIESVSATSRNIIKGDLKQRVPLQHGGDEFDHLALSINAMLDRIETLMDDLRQVTTDIAHDLRTPLTRLRNKLEIAQRTPADEHALLDVVCAARRETDVILDIFGALLRIAQVESGARKAAFARVDVSDIIDTVVEVYRPAAEERGQWLEGRVEGMPVMTGDKELLTQMLANLVENAIRHSRVGASISISAVRSGPRVEIRVADDGPGIPAAMRDRVLRRFVRLERSRTTPGSGLGLSLASAIAHLHDATLQLSDNAPGLKVTVLFESESLALAV